MPKALELITSSTCHPYGRYLIIKSSFGGKDLQSVNFYAHTFDLNCNLLSFNQANTKINDVGENTIGDFGRMHK